MFSSNSQKFLLLTLFALMLCSSCSSCQSTNNKETIKIIDAETQTNIPFPTKEPEDFQAEVVTKSFANGSESQQKYFVAKSGAASLQTFNAGSENERSFLRTFENKTFLINKAAKNYREISSEKSAAFANDSLIENLTSKWLNEKNAVSFEKAETADGLTKYRVKSEDANDTEVLIYIDENLKMPVKQEFYDISGNRKTLKFSFEIKNFRLQAEKSLFELPKDYRVTN